MEKFHIKALGDWASIALGNIYPDEYASVSHLLEEMKGEYLGDQSSLDAWIEATFSKHGWPYYKGMTFIVNKSDLMVSQILRMDWYIHLPDASDVVLCSMTYLEDLKAFCAEAINLYDKELVKMRRSRSIYDDYYWRSPYDRHLSLNFEIDIKTSHLDGLKQYLKKISELMAHKSGNAEM